MGEIPKSECAYADAIVGFAWHWHCVAESVQRVKSRADGRHSGMALSDSARKSTELLVGGSKKPDGTRA
jgi:hypothetical protein